ncbi:hypothetical protein CDL15_Pgr022302 [Punica granatum]|uniref:Uncharacterized protein n=1 Tax=Punica granatum TaxID=22663 RepID=A0A218WP74_PUNGR|nr:hypothetical protein CDL15_Pgr022302 [Punica granatum]
MLSYLLQEPWSGHLKLLRSLLKYRVPICCGLTIAFKGAESAASATVVSAWIAYVVICRYWMAYGILDATQCFATEASQLKDNMSRNNTSSRYEDSSSDEEMT